MMFGSVFLSNAFVEFLNGKKNLIEKKISGRLRQIFNQIDSEEMLLFFVFESLLDHQLFYF